jgi:ADP-heptose:LPS heptosyltransferase
VKKLLRHVLFFLLRLLRVLAQHGRRPASIHPRLLLVRSGHLGDLVLMTPVLEAVKTAAPDASITLLVAPAPHEIVVRHPAVDHVLVCPLPSRRDTPARALSSWRLLWRVARQIRQEHYDLAINLRPRFWWGAALLCLAGIPHRVGYATARSTPFLTHTLPPRQEHITVAQLRLASEALSILGYPSLKEPYTPERYPLWVLPSAQENKWVTERLRLEGIAPDAALIVIHPGSGATLKLWRASAWATCITELTRSWKRAPAAHWILTGTPAERPLLEAIARSTSVPVTLVTDATVGQLAALFYRASLVLGVDSGPLHLAVAQGVRTVQLFGPTDPERFGPWGSSQLHAVVASTHRCPACPAIPCGTLYVSPSQLESRTCVRLISEEQVLAAIATHFPDLVEFRQDWPA